MKTTQPVWKLVAQLGDAHPIEHGGHFVFVDTTGVYPPEAEVLIAPDDDGGQWEVRRYALEPCTFINGVLADNKYYVDKAAWFLDDIKSMCESIGIRVEDFVEMIVNGSVTHRAMAWHMIGDYHGFDNLDADPLRLSRAEVEARYASHPYVNDSVIA